MNHNPLDFEVTVFSAGRGVEVKHLPTGLTARSDTARSAHANRDIAFDKLYWLIVDQSDYLKQGILF